MLLLRLKRAVKVGKWGSGHLDSSGAWNVKQRLSPEAKPWDNGNAAGEKGQALMEIERLVGFSGTSWHVDS